MTVCGAARRAGARHVLIPGWPRVFSAYSAIGFSDLGQRYEQPLAAADYAAVRQTADRLLALGARDMFAEGVDAAVCATPRFRLTIEHEDEDAERVVELDDLHEAEGPSQARRPGVPRARACWRRCRTSRSPRAVTSPHRPPRSRGRGRSATAAAGTPTHPCTPWSTRSGRTRDRPGRDRRPVLHHAGPAGLAVRHHRSG